MTDKTDREKLVEIVEGTIKVGGYKTLLNSERQELSKAVADAILQAGFVQKDSEILEWEKEFDRLSDVEGCSPEETLLITDRYYGKENFSSYPENTFELDGDKVKKFIGKVVLSYKSTLLKKLGEMKDKSILTKQGFICTDCVVKETILKLIADIEEMVNNQMKGAVE